MGGSETVYGGHTYAVSAEREGEAVALVVRRLSGPNGSEVAAKVWLTAESAQRLAELLADEEDEEWQVQSSSDPEAFYTVRRDRDGWYCECPGFFYRGACGHIAKVKGHPGV